VNAQFDNSGVRRYFDVAPPYFFFEQDQIMKCEEAGELFSEYISGDMEAALSVSVGNHLAGCSECREAVAGLREIWGSLDGMELVEPPPYFHENLMSRINAAENAREEAEAARNSTFNWRKMFAPRTFAYAASLLLVLLAGMGGLHYNKAALDPIGSLIHLLKPASAHVVELSTSRAEWSPNAQGTGTLIVYLKAQPEADGKTSTLNCVVNLPAVILMPGAKTDLNVTSDSEASISIPVKTLPAQSSISVTLSAKENGQLVASKTEPITLMQPVEQH
jgi:hypothetical protein